MTTVELNPDLLCEAALVVNSDEKALKLDEASNLIHLAMTALRLTSEVRKTTLCNTLGEFSLDQVSHHDSFSDCWIVIYDRVYDVTEFLQSHPGGLDVLLEHAGRDATFAFRGSGHSFEAVQMLKKFEIGILPQHERLYRTENGLFQWDRLPE